jgi:hypothetical protein
MLWISVSLNSFIISLLKVLRLTLRFSNRYRSWPILFLRNLNIHSPELRVNREQDITQGRVVGRGGLEYVLFEILMISAERPRQATNEKQAFPLRSIQIAVQCPE